MARITQSPRGATAASDRVGFYEEERGVEFLIFLVVIAAIAGAVLWGRKNFRQEIDRAKRIRRANKNQ